MFSEPTSAYLMEFTNNNSKIKYGICSVLAIEATDFILGSLLLTLPNGILYCLNLKLSMCFRARSRSPVTFKTKLSLTTVNYSF